MLKRSHRTRKGKTPWQRRRGQLLIGIMIPIVFFGGVVVWRIQLRQELNSQWNVYLEAGYPTTVEEFWASYPPIPDEENGALVLMEAFDKLASPDEVNWRWRNAEEEPHSPDTIKEELARFEALENAALDEEFEVWTPHTAGVVADYVAANSEVMAGVEQALSLEKFRFPVDDFELGFAWNASHWDHVGSVADLYQFQVVLRLQDGDVQRAVESLAIGFQLPNILTDEPFYFAQSTRFVAGGRALRALEYVMRTVQLTEPQIGPLQDAIEAMVCRSCWQRGIVGDACATLLYRTHGGTIWDFAGITDEDETEFLRETYRIAALFELPYHEGIVEYGKPFRSIGSIFTMIARPLKWMFPYDWALNLAASQEARAVTAHAALSVERFRLAHEKLPETLEELVPEFMDEIPIDPFTGESLSYRLLEVGYEVSSAGPFSRSQDTPTRSPVDFTVTR